VSKKHIIICDDKPKWTERFEKEHSGEFEVDTYNDSVKFMKELRELKKRGQTPDIILIDLFHPNDASEDVIKEGEEAIEKLNTTIKEVRDPIYKAWDPNGFDLLEQARKLFPDTPIAIYTEQGVSVADDKELERVSKAEGEWLLKGKNKNYESIRINNLMEKTCEQDSNMTIIILCSFVMVALTFIVMTHTYFKAIFDAFFNIMAILAFIATLVQLVVTLRPDLISRFIRK